MQENKTGGGTTSQKVRYTVELERVTSPMVKRAVNEMVKNLEGEILTQKEFNIFKDTLPVRGTCVKFKEAMFPVDIFVDEQGKLIVNGDDMDVRRIAKQAKQFYKAMNIALLTGANIDYNKNNKKVKLKMRAR